MPPPKEETNNEETLIALSNHLNSFLGSLNLGGLFHHPISEKQICHVERKGNELNQVSVVGDEYSTTTMDRALQRYSIPYLKDTPMIDSNWVVRKIYTLNQLHEAYLLGKSIVESLDMKTGIQILALEAYSNYTLHKWSNSLLLGWAFIENMIELLWKNHILSNTKGKQKDRLKDQRTYTAAVKIETLYFIKIINYKLYSKLTKLRQSRNNLMHDGLFVNEKNASPFFEIITELIKLLTSHEARFNNPGWTRSAGWANK